MFSNFKYTIFFFFTIFATGFTISQPLRLPPFNSLLGKTEAPEIRNNRTFQPTQRQEEIEKPEEELFPQDSFLKTSNPHWLSFLETDNPHWNSFLATEELTIPIGTAAGIVYAVVSGGPIIAECPSILEQVSKGIGIGASGAFFGGRLGAVVGIPISIGMTGGGFIGREIGKTVAGESGAERGEALGEKLGLVAGVALAAIALKDLAYPAS